MQTPKFPKGKPPFSVVLKERVGAYFAETQQKITGDHRLYWKAAILVLAFVALYVHLVFFTPAWYWAILECIVLGFAISAIGFNIMHDGSHGSFSNRPWVNTAAAFTLSVLGGSAFMWNNKHCIIHHTYTNVHDLDDDLDAGIFLRLSEHQKKYKMHSFQHYYFWFMYMQLYLFWILFSDYKKYFTRKIGDMPLKKMSVMDHILFWKFKVINLSLFAIIPIWMVGFTPWLIGFLVTTQIGGLVLSLVFQLAHTVEDTTFPLPDDANKMEDEWVVHQLKTTANFATKSKIVCWFVGGLNFQVEHHLFPKISHIHYPAISKIIKQACAEYGIVYNEYPRVYQAVASHVSHLRHLAKIS
ncbi:fatty acid desaturase family protein [Polluticaenibacter yanchengensis]|uniref:Acyl-CoA desaturase n=1 Tax=Polluticaenibacter yanchengensis TaxID=3014562 RepID=A0ABT4UIG3_9BACT|nr:acyl-CoA desaturase [Chitinophagaceae bacterium LY-5]